MPFELDEKYGAKNVGCKELDLQVEKVESDLHVYGHTKIVMDSMHGNRCVAAG